MAHPIAVHMAVRSADEAAAWYVERLGAEERGRIAVPDGRLMQVALEFGDSKVMLCDEFPEIDVLAPTTIGGTAVVLHLQCDDVDSTWQRVLAGGATVRTELADQDWGERYGQIVDPFGHRWGLAQQIA
jgi:PhnB protein